MSESTVSNDLIEVSSSTPTFTFPISNRRVLLVDDDPLILRAFKRDLSNTEIELTILSSPAEGLAELRDNQYALVLSDYQMPGMDGIEFLKEVSLLNPDAVRILISGRADFEMAIRVINKVGLFNFVAKPWDPLELRDTIRRALEHYEMISENRRLNNELSRTCAELGQLTSELEDEVQSRTTHLLVGLVNALDLRDTETHFHSRRVAMLARMLASKLGIEGEELLAIERGALLHDVGKIGVSDTILLKPAKLTEEEWVEMRRHPEHGYHILKGIDFLGEARRLVREHHERWNGGGYPRGIEGKNIFIGARIFAIIDTYDAITSDRPYRKAQSHAAANAEIQRWAGIQFDPEIVEAWLSIPQAEIDAINDGALDMQIGLH